MIIGNNVRTRLLAAERREDAALQMSVREMSHTQLMEAVRGIMDRQAATLHQDLTGLLERVKSGSITEAELQARRDRATRGTGNAQIDEFLPPIAAEFDRKIELARQRRLLDMTGRLHEEPYQKPIAAEG